MADSKAPMGSSRAPRSPRGREPSLETARDDSSLLEATSSKIVESLRYLVAREQLGDQSSFPARLAVVSPVGDEGVTTVSRTLASMMAHDLEAQVCWVDLNFGVDNAEIDEADRHPRLADVLNRRCRLEAALEPTSHERLTLLRAGSVPLSRRPVLARSTMLEDVFEQLDSLFGYVVLDMPPVLTSSESLALLRHARAYLLVARHGVTTMSQIRATSDELRTIPSLGVVLNKYAPQMPIKLQRLFAR